MHFGSVTIHGLAACVVTYPATRKPPATVRPYLEQIPDARPWVFANSAHLPHVEETELYLRVVSRFLAGDESAKQ